MSPTHTNTHMIDKSIEHAASHKLQHLHKLHFGRAQYRVRESENQRDKTINMRMGKPAFYICVCDTITLLQKKKLVCEQFSFFDVSVACVQNTHESICSAGLGIFLFFLSFVSLLFTISAVFGLSVAAKMFCCKFTSQTDILSQ